jgi:hypothetical protein
VTYSYTDASIQCRLLIQSGYCLGGDELCFKSTECPAADYKFLTLYPTNFTVLDEMLAVLQSLAGRKPTPPTLRYSHYRTNPEAICINQDVPTCFYAVQRSRLPIIAMLLDRGLSDTNTGEVNQDYSTKLSNILYSQSEKQATFPSCFPPSLSHWSENCRQLTRNSSHAPLWVRREASCCSS